jgi:hypothetical protein
MYALCVYGNMPSVDRLGKECFARGGRAFGYAKYASSPLLIVAFYVPLSAGAGDKGRK